MTFGDTTTYIIRKGAFAVNDTKDAVAMTTFAFPRANQHIIFNSTGNGEGSQREYEDNGNIKTGNDEEKYDYILAGRRSLEEVTLPARLAGAVPDFTFMRCNKLGYVLFPYDENASTGDASYDPARLFKDVENSDLYVEGPALTSNEREKAQPRKNTWFAVSEVAQFVPYMFKDEDGTHFEIGTHGGSYIATVDVVEGSSDAVLSKYAENTELDPSKLLSEDVSITIPAKVGDYTVVEIGDNCFEAGVGEKKGLKEKVTEIIIPDGSVRRINNEAFKGMPALQWVEIGDSVSYIGDSAFEDCTNLENVVFSQTLTADYGDDPSYWTSALEIGTNAFKTNSNLLTFHGAINENYAPFKLAMSENNSDMLASRSQIFYVTDEPLNLRVIRDNATGLATLIDYPHYEEIDSMNGDRDAVLQERVDKEDKVEGSYSITDKFEIVHGMRQDTDSHYKGAETMYPLEEDIVDQALNLKLPSGIQSIDSKSYFSNSANANDSMYFTNIYIDKYKELIAQQLEIVNGSGSDTDKSAAKAKIAQYESQSDYEVNPPATASKDLDDLKRNLFDEDGNKVGKSNKKVDAVKKLYYEYEPKLQTPQNPDPGTTPKPDQGNKYLNDGIDDNVIAGLFSGLFNESNKSGIATASFEPDVDTGKLKDNAGFIESTASYDNHKYVEVNDRGNDYLTRIVNMGSVEELPALAFNSAENLLEVKLSPQLKKVKELPFRDCKSMYNIDTNGNSKYTFDNMIFLEQQDDGGNMIVQCLEGRGKTEMTGGDPGVSYGLDRINTDTNPSLSTVTSIADYAFSNIENLTEADLSATSVKKIPEGIFDNDEALTEVYIPMSANEIEQYAFRGCAGSNGTLKLHISNPLCVISDKAFDFDRTRKVVIYGVEFVDEHTGEESPCYNSYLQLEKVYSQNKIEFMDEGNEYLVEYVDDTLAPINDNSGKLASYPVKSHENAPSAVTAPTKTGYKFNGWICRIGDTVLRDEECNGRQNYYRDIHYRPQRGSIGWQ